MARRMQGRWKIRRPQPTTTRGAWTQTPSRPFSSTWGWVRRKCNPALKFSFFSGANAPRWRWRRRRQRGGSAMSTKLVSRFKSHLLLILWHCQCCLFQWYVKCDIYFKYWSCRQSFKPKCYRVVKTKMVLSLTRSLASTQLRRTFTHQTWVSGISIWCLF